MGQPHKRLSTLKILLLAAGLAVAAEVLSIIGLDRYPHGSFVFSILGILHELPMHLVDHLMPDFFDYPDETTNAQEFLASVVLYGLPVLEWFCILLPGIYAIRRCLKLLNRSSDKGTKGRFSSV